MAEKGVHKSLRYGERLQRRLFTCGAASRDVPGSAGGGGGGYQEATAPLGKSEAGGEDSVTQTWYQASRREREKKGWSVHQRLLSYLLCTHTVL